MALKVAIGIEMSRFALLGLCGAWPWSSPLDDVVAPDYAPINVTEEDLTFNFTEDAEFGWWSVSGAINAFWYFKKIGEGFQSDDGRWFGTPGRPGRLRQEGGWIGYVVDGVGVHALGAWWPFTVYCIGAISAVVCLVLLSYSLYTLTAPIRWFMQGIKKILELMGCGSGGGVRALLPPAPSVPTEVEWHGPRTGWPTETRYLQSKLKGRGSRRKLNDVVIRHQGHVARLQQEERLLRRIDSNGLRVKFSQILGCTSRQLRRELERIGEIHICRLKDCQENHELHIQEFAGIDHEVLVDLHRFAHGSPRWLLGVGWRCIVAGLGLFFRFLRCCWRRCCRPRGTRVIRDDSGAERALDPDSESEVEVDEAACQGVRIGIIVDGAMRPLAPDGCNDVAADEEVTLLDEDIEVSDIRPPGPGQTARVPLCPHHKQLYQSASSARKCGVMTCFKAAKGAKHGVPLCYDHLCDQGAGSTRKDSPHPAGMLNNFKKRFGRKGYSRSRSPPKAECNPEKTDETKGTASNRVEEPRPQTPTTRPEVC